MRDNIKNITAELISRGVTSLQVARCITLYPEKIILKAIQQLPKYQLEPDLAHTLLYRKLNYLSNIDHGKDCTSMYQEYRPLSAIFE